MDDRFTGKVLTNGGRYFYACSGRRNDCQGFVSNETLARKYSAMKKY
jgi:hypothetical protein